MELLNRGFYINTTDLSQVQRVIMQFSVYLIERHQEMLTAFHNKLANITQTSSDNQRLSRTALRLWGSGWEGLPMHLSNKFDKQEMDTEFKLYLYPDLKGKQIYGLCKSGRDAWFREWLRHALVADYSVDPGPSGKAALGADEWDRRNEVWHSLIPDFSQPELFAFVIDPVRRGSPLTALDSQSAD